MDHNVRTRMNTIELLAKSDAEYCRMIRQMRERERNYDAILQTLPNDQQDAVCDFVSQCEDMSRRKLELACIHMRFSE